MNYSYLLLAAQVTETSYGTGHGWAKYTQFGCFGNETTLSQCNYKSSDSCQSYDPDTGYVSIAQIKCSGDSAQGKPGEYDCH